MNLLFDLGHPAHVHLFRHTIHSLSRKNHKVIITTKDQSSITKLLNAYRFPYICLGTKHDSIVGKGISHICYVIKTLHIALKHKIDIAIGSSITITHVSRIIRMHSIVLDDDDKEAVPMFVRFAHPFADTILSPDTLAHQRNGYKHLVYPGYHELAYLHPNHFNPNHSILHQVGLDEKSTYFILRFVALKSYHDIGQTGLTPDQKRKIINILKPYGKIFITSEREIEEEFKPYLLQIPQQDIHDLLYFATLFIGDSQTMTTEAALLGVPAFKCNTFAGILSVPNELEKKYGLCYSYHPKDFDNLISKLRELLEKKNIKNEWHKKRDSMLREKIDVSKFLTWFIECYPESHRLIKQNSSYAYRFLQYNPSSR